LAAHITAGTSFQLGSSVSEVSCELPRTAHVKAGLRAIEVIPVVDRDGVQRTSALVEQRATDLHGGRWRKTG